MPRLMSVSLTESQVRARTKTVTRRAGWLMLKPGDHLTLCKKVQGRRKGEPLERITDVEVVSVRREPLHAIMAADVAAEGFPEWTPDEFVAFFCGSHKGIRPDSDVTRIKWRYLGHTIGGPHYDMVGHNPTLCHWDIPHCGPCWIRGEPRPANPGEKAVRAQLEEPCP